VTARDVAAAGSPSRRRVRLGFEEDGFAAKVLLGENRHAGGEETGTALDAEGGSKLLWSAGGPG
jgi:hypothetical protein